MAESMVWGSLGDVVFEFLTSPVYGTIRHNRRARFNQRSRIISRAPTGALLGQKPLKEPAGLELSSVSFTCKVSALILKTIDINVLESLALMAGAGPLVGSALGEEQEDLRFYTDVLGFIDTLNTVLETQDPLEFTEGSNFIGMYTLDELDISEKHKKDGEIFTAEIGVSLSEWVE
jgi:hypothetical protein